MLNMPEASDLSGSALPETDEQADAAARHAVGEALPIVSLAELGTPDAVETVKLEAEAAVPKVDRTPGR